MQAVFSEPPALTDCIPSELNPPLKAILVKSDDELEQVRQFLEQNTVFGLDIETNVTDETFDRYVRTIQVGNKDVVYVIDLFEFAGSASAMIAAQGQYGKNADLLFGRIISTLKPFLESKTHLKVGHNLSFEYINLKWCLGFRTWNLYDTMLAEKALYAGEVSFKISGFWALDDLMARYFRLKISKELQKSFGSEKPLTWPQVEYAALDARFAMAIKSVQHAKITKANLWKACTIEFDAIPAFGDMHLNGLLIDEAKWMTLVGEVVEVHKANLAALDAIFLPVFGKKYVANEEEVLRLEELWRNSPPKSKLFPTERADARKAYMEARKKLTQYKKDKDKYEGEANVKYTSPADLLAALRQMGYTKKQLKSTNDEHLKKLEGDKTIDAIREYRETKKVLTTYGETFLTHKSKITGRIHSDFDQYGAETGRTSSRNPNVQNILKGKDWRACFVSRPGYKMLTLDYNGCELRILAEYSGERVFVEAFRNGWDVHSVGAEIIFGDRWRNAAAADCAFIARHAKCSCPEHKSLRDKIKSINFGIAYGMEAKKLAGEVGITVQEAKELLAAYRAAFPTLIAYLTKSGNQAKVLLESRTLAFRRRKYERPSWDDAKRIAIKKAEDDGVPLTTDLINKMYQMLFSSIEREGKNTPIQGSNADMIKLAVGCGFDSKGQPFLWHILEPVFQAMLENLVHDELVVECKDEVADECFHRVGDAMKRAGAEFVKLVPMEYEGNIDTKWKK